MDLKQRPLGIFDSGIGGLTVLKEIMEVLPDEDTVYLGDTARVPYGTKSGPAVRRYAVENAGFLLKHGIKLLVVACNTASAYALDELKESLDIPVIGVILPGARMAAAVSRNKKVGVIGTEGTIKSGAYFDAIKSIDPEVTVFSKACPLFVPLAEEGWTEGEVARLVAEEYLKEIKGEGVDVVLLGCTHYPLLKKVIAGVMGEGVKLIDSAYATAIEVKNLLSQKGLLREKGEDGRKPLRKFFVTDSPERFLKVGKRFLSDSLKEAELIKAGS